MTHTPGPWTIHTTEIFSGTIADKILSAHGTICLMPTLAQVPFSAQQITGTARFIAAAPRMLEVVQLLVEWDDSNDNPLVISRACSQARALLAEIKGKGPA